MALVYGEPKSRHAPAETAPARANGIGGRVDGLDPIFQGAADFDLELVENRTVDGHTQKLIYRPTLH